MDSEIEQIIRWVAAGIIILIELVVLFSLLTNKGSKLQMLIKDMSGQEEIRDMSFSYSRSQLLWWTFIVITCFAVDMAMTGASNGIMNSTALTLLGIGAGTTLAGRVIDNSQSNDPSIELHQHSTSQGFWMDILSDQNGISIHRFQAVLFNLGFGIAFISQFISNIPDSIQIGTAIPFPDFDNTTLGLIGLSAATYATLKFNENLSPARSVSVKTEVLPAPVPAAAPVKPAAPASKA
jgi:hypothetical protein